ncbi:hypothetical protein BE221DRAFT_66355 [Ostreococcus tauri]|uniref:Uncharacterized protein n=1 Tax=Ostreococcus tauri TaxID=70448 RepID=A0A1Y5IIJ6_OSTTA|nr:hypothetical protein BE221DRAFT_66355 [Ostreococcus tauri]
MRPDSVELSLVLFKRTRREQVREREPNDGRERPSGRFAPCRLRRAACEESKKARRRSECGARGDGARTDPRVGGKTRNVRANRELMLQRDCHRCDGLCTGMVIIFA